MKCCYTNGKEIVTGVECDKHERELPSKYHWKERNRDKFINILNREVASIDHDVNKYDSPDDMLMYIT